MILEMKVSPKTIVKVEGDNVKAVFAAIAEAQEIFGHDKCGKCGSPNIVFSHRSNGDNSFYSMKCLDCHAGLDFLQNRASGGLFAKLKDKAGNWIDNGGWYVFKKNEEENPFG